RSLHLRPPPHPRATPGLACRQPPNQPSIVVGSCCPGVTRGPTVREGYLGSCAQDASMRFRLTRTAALARCQAVPSRGSSSGCRSHVLSFSLVSVCRVGFRLVDGSVSVVGRGIGGDDLHCRFADCLEVVSRAGSDEHEISDSEVGGFTREDHLAGSLDEINDLVVV